MVYSSCSYLKKEAVSEGDDNLFIMILIVPFLPEHSQLFNSQDDKPTYDISSFIVLFFSLFLSRFVDYEEEEGNACNNPQYP
jgi:hypothetical protein